MDFYFIPSLQQLTLVRLADTLWTDDCMNWIKFCMDTIFKAHNWQYKGAMMDKRIGLFIRVKFETILCRKIANLPLPNLIQDSIYHFAEKLGIQKAKWYYHHLGQWNIQKFPSVFYYTSWGTINRRKTAINLITDVDVHICKRYVLACFYCYEDELYTLRREAELSRVDLNGIPRGYQVLPYINDEYLLFAWDNIILRKERRRQNHIDFDDEAYAVIPTEVDHALLSLDTRTEGIFLSAYLSPYRYSKEAGNNYAVFFFRSMLTPPQYAASSEAAKEDRIVWDVLSNYATGMEYEEQDMERFLENAIVLLRCMTTSRREEVFRTRPRFLSLVSSGFQEHSIFSL